ncbi:hypothetical protein [Planktothrix paucivesiculata]|uniref:Uncharacterized protein n=1 Tax=Planktothrix paucivesiculata PCC 9631 TaxID=671071 RepID=A0A7Z9BIS6_9CYAN|nr:hypothetical protein [Planktothrix paucivesiculata]VXD15014.1 conserved hypothetical protein [Planktothrix paucivesiculata PCC 9631]
MALFGLFGKKGDSKPPEETGSGFYLEGNTAQGLGDVDRFKNMPAVKKTFPVEVEAPKSTKAKPQSSSTASNSVTEEPSSKSERRRADSSMDMYRNLAREIKKP